MSYIKNKNLLTGKIFPLNKNNPGITKYTVQNDVLSIVPATPGINGNELREELKQFEASDTEALFNCTDDHLWSVDCDLRLIAANKAFITAIESFIGLSLKPGDELLLKDIFHKDILTFWQDLYKRALTGESFKEEIYTPAFNNWKETWMDTSFNPIYKNGLIVGIACYSKNITEKKLAEEKLRQSEARLIQAQEVAKLGSWETDLSNLEVICSEEIYRIFELNPARFKASHPAFLEFVHPDDRPKVEAAFVNSFDGHSINTIQHRIITATGIVKTVEERWRIFRNDEGKPAKAVGSCQDITERTKAEENINNSEEKRKLIMNAALDAIICIDINGDITFWNPQAEVIFGWTETEALGQPLAQLIIPEQYRSRHNEGMALYLKTGKGPALNKLMELSAVKRNGEEFPIELTIMPIKQGGEDFFCAFVRNITERKKADIALQAAYEEKNIILESIADGFFTVDKNWTVTYWNHMAEKMLGTPKNSIVGFHLWEVFSDSNGSKSYHKYHQALETNQAVEFEDYYLQLDKWFEISAYPSTTGLSVYFKDISERKNSEAALHIAYEEKNTVLERIDDGFFAVDKNSIVTYWNKRAEILLNAKRRDMIGKNLHEVLATPASKAFYDNYQKAIREKSTVHFVEFSTRMNKWFSVSAYASDNGLSVYFKDVTEQKNAEEKLKESELRYRSLIEQAADTICIADASGKFIEMNPSGCKLFGYTREEILQLFLADVLFEEDLKTNPLQFNELKAGKTTSNERRVKRKDGTAVEVELNAKMIEDGRIMIFGRDITERKKNTNKIKESELRYRSIIEQATDAICIADPFMKIIDINPYCCEMLGYTKEEILQLSIRDIFLPEDLIRNPFKIAELQTGKVIRNERRLKRKDSTLIEVEISARILEDGRFIVFAHDIAERKKAEDKIKESELRYRSLNEQATDAICITDASLRFINVNPYGCEILGYTEEEALQLSLPDILFAEDLKDNPIKLKELKLGQTIRNERRLKRKDGSAVDMEVSTKLMEDGRMIMFGHDITERKKTEKLINESQNRYRQIVETAQEGIWLIDENDYTNFVNKKMCEIVGYSQEELIGKKIYHFMDDESGKNALLQIERRKQGFSEIHDSSFITKSGKHVWVNLSTNPVMDEYGKYKGALAMITDITERKHAELQLKESNERYNLISQATNDMVWDWDLVTGKVYRNKEGWKKIFRTGDKDIENENIDDWDSRVHPDDQQKVQEVEAEIQKSEKDFFEVECRMLRDDGTYAYIHDRGNIIRNEQGMAVRLIGATQDITARKEAELQVAKSEFRFRSLVQNSSDLITILDERAYYLFCTPAVKKILGYEPEYVIGKNAFSFLHPDDIATVKADLSKAKTGPYFEVDAFRFKNAKGEWRWLESRVTDMRDNPEVNGFVFNSRDVTERKMAEAEIEKLSFIARETTNAVIITNPEGKILWVNEAFTKITEFEFDEVIGRKPGDFLHGEDTNLAVVRYMRSKIKNAEPFECDIINYSRTGRKYWLRIQNQPQYDEAGKLKYFFAIETDITKEKEAEEILKASEERYRYLFNNNPASMLIWDINSFEILEINDTAIQFYGYERKEFLTKTVFDISLEEDSNKIKRFASLARQKTDLTSEVSCRHINKAGEEVHMHISSHLIQFKGRSVILAMATDITGKVTLENELENERQLKQQEITQAVITAQENERQELGSELHDNINQILAGSRLYLGLAQKELKTVHPYLTETDTLIAKAITEIRTLSHSLIAPSLQESELLVAIDNIVEMTQKTSGIVISLQAFGFDETNIPDKLKMSIFRIIQEQFNNILKHARAQKVIVRLVQDKEKILLSIKDDGVGFDTGKKPNGVGLLNIKTRASLFNGSLTIISSPDNGCELRVVFN